MSKISSIIMFSELAAIVVLLWTLSREYQANVYMQMWVGANAWFLDYFLNGYAVAVLFGILIAGMAIASVRDEWVERLGRRRKTPDVE